MKITLEKKEILQLVSHRSYILILFSLNNILMLQNTLAFLHNKSNKTLAKKEMTRIAEANTGHFPKQISIYSTVLMQSKQITAYQGKSKDILIPSYMCIHS